MIAKWVEHEFAEIDLKDKRRNQRAKVIATALAAASESAPDAARGATTAALDATYRFMRNDAIAPEAILQSHSTASIRRTTQHERVLLVQDTTEIDLTKPQRQVKGAGPLSSNSRFGFYLHPLMAYTQCGIPLGIVACHHWTREAIDCESTPNEKRKIRNRLPIEEKESYRWLEMTQRGQQFAAAAPNTEYVGVSDSESDIGEVLSEMAARPDNYHFLVRACQPRSILTSVCEGREITARSVAEALEQAPVAHCKRVQVSSRTAKAGVLETRSRRTSRKAREARLEIRALSVRMKVKPAASSRLQGEKRVWQQLNVVQARELDTPPGEEPIEWILLTTLPIDTAEQIEEVLECYTVRWNIEVFFMTLKSGLKVEQQQYRTLSRYVASTMFLLISAWRVQCLTQAGRHEPETSCEECFEESEWKSALLVTSPNKPLPAKAPTMREFLIVVATLGGYINRKQQGPPGVRTVWRGIHRLETLANAYRLFRQVNTT